MQTIFGSQKHGWPAGMLSQLHFSQRLDYSPWDLHTLFSLLLLCPVVGAVVYMWGSNALNSFEAGKSHHCGVLGSGKGSPFNGNAAHVLQGGF